MLQAAGCAPAATSGREQAASPAAAPSQAPAPAGLYSVVLDAAQARPYVLCSPDDASREACAARFTQADRTLAALRAAALRPGVARVVLFVPGYRTKYADGRRNAAFVQGVFGPRFLVVHVDWGSHGVAADYELDGAAAKKNAPAFAALLSDLRGALPESKIDVFAHSMGARVAAGAMAIVKMHGASPVVDDAVLAAPDMTLADYKRAIAREPEPFAHVLVYASNHDRALLLSDVVHLRKRLGQLDAWRRAVATTEVIDASAAPPGPAGHGYAIRDTPVLWDIGAVFLGAPAPHPGWQPAQREAFLWVLMPGRVPPLDQVPAVH